MGQYYRIAFRHVCGDVQGKIVVNDRKITGHGYIMAKLMEHSWLGCYIADAVAYEMHRNPMRLAWIGDYADGEKEVENATGYDLSYERVWKHDHRHAFPDMIGEFDYSHKFLVNHSKRQLVDLDGYSARSRHLHGGVICPFSLLTAIGNNRGGGDYRDDNTDYDKVGAWTWDVLSIEDGHPDGFEEFNVCFKEV